MNRLSTIPRAFVGRLQFGGGPDPVRDWLVLLSLSGIMLAGIIVWNVWAFSTVANGGTIGTAAAPAPEIFKRSSIEEVNAVFVHHVTERSKYSRGVYQYADPSQ